LPGASSFFDDGPGPFADEPRGEPGESVLDSSTSTTDPRPPQPELVPLAGPDSQAATAPPGPHDAPISISPAFFTGATPPTPGAAFADDEPGPWWAAGVPGAAPEAPPRPRDADVDEMADATGAGTPPDPVETDEPPDAGARTGRASWDRRLYRLFKPVRTQARQLAPHGLDGLVRASLAEVRGR
jgi:hypothetical protein